MTFFPEYKITRPHRKSKTYQRYKNSIKRYRTWKLSNYQKTILVPIIKRPLTPITLDIFDTNPLNAPTGIFFKILKLKVKFKCTTKKSGRRGKR
jgi:hypothetical protein